MNYKSVAKQLISNTFYPIESFKSHQDLFDRIVILWRDTYSRDSQPSMEDTRKVFEQVCLLIGYTEKGRFVYKDNTHVFINNFYDLTDAKINQEIYISDKLFEELRSNQSYFDLSRIQLLKKNEDYLYIKITEDKYIKIKYTFDLSDEKLYYIHNKKVIMSNFRYNECMYFCKDSYKRQTKTYFKACVVNNITIIKTKKINV